MKMVQEEAKEEDVESEEHEGEEEPKPTKSQHRAQFQIRLEDIRVLCEKLKAKFKPKKNEIVRCFQRSKGIS